MVLKKFTSILNKRPGGSQDDYDIPDVDTPEANAARGVRLFCESSSATSGDEVLHLPTIVEAAVAAPSAAAAAATQIRRFLSKDNINRPHVQYNAIMLVRILADNPGPSFTKNMDTKFVDTVKQLLRRSQDPSVRQILIETLNALDREKAYDTNLNELFTMWRKEQGLGAGAPSSSFGPRTLNAPAWDPNQANGGHRSHRQKGLPAPAELAARIEEARTSAKLLLQLVQSTPPAELFSNDLIKEFAGRCQSAQRSVQGYINCDNPAPDDDTMLTLIETNEQLSLAASKHQRAVLQARKAVGPNTTPSPPPQGAIDAFAPPPGPPPSHTAAPISGAPSLPPLTTDTTQHQHQQPYSNIPAVPSSLQGQHASRPESENPFSDENESYAPPAGPPPPPPRSNTGPVATPDPYRSPYDTSQSYLQRQESASANLTMHGASNPDTAPTTTTQDRSQQPRNGSYGRYEDGDVSPIETRSPVTYRY